MTELTADALMRPLPPGRHGLSREQVAASQRARLFWAIVKRVGETSYAATTIADITNAADVSKKTFYKHFRDKEHCFLDAYGAFADLVLQTTRAGFEKAGGPDDTWLDQYRTSTAAYLDVLSAQPVRTRALLLEVLSAGPAALDARRKAMTTFEDNLAAVHAAARRTDPRVRDIQPITLHLAVGGIDECVRRHIQSDRCAQLPELLEPIVSHVERLFIAG